MTTQYVEKRLESYLESSIKEIIENGDEFFTRKNMSKLEYINNLKEILTRMLNSYIGLVNHQQAELINIVNIDVNKVMQICYPDKIKVIKMDDTLLDDNILDDDDFIVNTDDTPDLCEIDLVNKPNKSNTNIITKLDINILNEILDVDDGEQ